MEEDEPLKLSRPFSGINDLNSTLKTDVNTMRGSRNFRQGGGPGQSDKKSSDNVFFFFFFFF